jgi:hypothetical protein
MSDEIDAAIDSWIVDPNAFDPKAFKMVSLLRGKGAKAAQARYIKGFFASGLAELKELSSGHADDQLKEGYRHVSRKNVNKLIEFYESIAQACEQIAAEAKVLKKPRAKKVKPAEELVKRIKFKMTDDKLGVTSVPAAGLIGAQAAIVYNAKTRKFGMYIAKTSAGLNVKGTSIIDFTEKSFQRTLRKPPEQLKEFKDNVIRMMKYYNAYTLVELTNTEAVDWFIERGHGAYFAEGLGIAKEANPFAQSGFNTKGIKPTPGIQRHYMNQEVEYSKEKLSERITETGVIKEQLGLTRVLDTMLLEEWKNYRSKDSSSKGVHDGNFDRIIAFGHALMLARHLDKVQPLTGFKFEDSTEQKQHNVILHSPFSPTNKRRSGTTGFIKSPFIMR